MENSGSFMPVEETPPSPQSVLEWGRALLDKENLSDLFQFLKGPTLIAAALLGGAPVIAAAGLVLIGVGIGRVRTRKEHDRKQLLDLYKDEIAQIVHKRADALTTADLDTVRKAGGRNAITLELDSIDRDAQLSSITGTVTTLVMTAL